MAYYYGSYKINPDETLDIKVRENPIRLDALEQYRSSIKVLIELQPVTSGYECASRNRDTLIKFTDNLHKRMHSGELCAWFSANLAYEIFYAMNQHINNFIWSSRMFIEHTEGHLKRTFGVDSEQFARYKSATAKLYDNHFSYRFICELRNYSSHRNLPVSRVNLNAKRDGSDASPRLEIAFFIERDEFLANFGHNRKAALREEVARLNASIDLLPLVEEQAEWNRFLFQGVIEQEKERLIHCKHYLRNLQKHLDLPSDEVPVIWEGEERPPIRHELILFTDLDHILDLLRRQGPTCQLNLPLPH